MPILFLTILFVFCALFVFVIVRPEIFNRFGQRKNILRNISASVIICALALFLSIQVVSNHVVLSAVSVNDHILSSSTSTFVESSEISTTSTVSLSVTQSIAEPILSVSSLIIEPRDGIAPVIALINHAKISVDLVMYQLEDTLVENALINAKNRGVIVRVLLNKGYYGVDERHKNDSAFSYLKAHKVAVKWTPSYFALTHQKTLVVDRKDALIMTFNFTPQYYPTGREFGINDTNVYDITAIESAFDNDWNAQQKIASNGNYLVWSPHSESILVSLIKSASSTVFIYSEEMNEQAIESALESVAERGVDVEVVMTAESNWDTAFRMLSATGVHIHTFFADAPLYIHAKMILVDDARAFVGSENFSYSSLEKNRELGVMVYDSTTLASLSRTFEEDLQASNTFVSSVSTKTSSATVSSTILYYTSSYSATKYYYPSDCIKWKNLGAKYRVSFSSVHQLLVAYPDRILNPDCSR